MSAQRLVRPPISGRYRPDVMLLVEQAAGEGYIVSEADAEWAWQRHSDAQEASWLFLDDDPEVNVRVLRDRLEVEEMPDD